MSVSMKDLDPVFQGAGQKEYPNVTISNLSTCYCASSLFFEKKSLFIMILSRACYTIEVYIPNIENLSCNLNATCAISHCLSRFFRCLLS